MQSQTVEALVAFRFIQAIGGCVAWVAATAMVRDFFPVEESAKIFSLLVLVLGASPLLAPTIGGFITEALGWKWVFIALAILVLLVLIVVAIYLPEVHKPDPGVSLKPKPMLLIFYSILTNPQFYTYTLAGAFSFSNMFIYVAGSPVIFMELYQVSPQAYGGIFALLSIGFIGGNQLNILLLRRFKSEQIFGVALIFQLLISVVFLIGAYNNWFGLYSTIGMFFLILSSLGLTYPNSSALALAPFTKNIGSASALLGAAQIGVAAFVSSSVGFFNATSSIPITAMLAASASIAFILLLIGRQRIQRKFELA
jgi:DHA1 family bicyclomycin/chloramphenicol resistance-like MFS transporter